MALTGLNAPVVAQSLSEKVVDLLIEAIEKGDLAPGTRIREATLARQLGISRGPLREALRRLEGRKLLHYTPNLGMRVAETSKAELIEIFEMREVLEGLACRLASERMSDAALAELGTLLTQHLDEPELSRGDAYYQRAGEFDLHYRIALGSENERLVDYLCRDLYHFMRIYRYRSSASPGRAARAFEEHRAIVAAMQARDGEAAERLMRQHIRAALDQLRREPAD